MKRMRREYHYLKAILDHPETPPVSRWLIGAGIAYLVSPIDFVPDVIPVIGQLDDVIVTPILIWIAMLFVPPMVKRDARRRTTPVELPGAGSSGASGASAAQALEIQPIRGPFGVRITDSSAAELSAEELLDVLTDLVIEHRVVVVDRARCAPLLDPDVDNGVVESERLNGHLAESDHSLTILEGLEAAAESQTLCFLDRAAAYDALSDEHKRTIATLKLRPCPVGGLSLEVECRPQARTEPSAREADAAPRGSVDAGAGLRTIVVEHPVTRRKFLSPIPDDVELEQSPPEAPTDLLERLRSHQQEPRFRCTHEHEHGDVVLWDSGATLESRTLHPRAGPSESSGRLLRVAIGARRQRR